MFWNSQNIYMYKCKWFVDTIFLFNNTYDSIVDKKKC